MYTIINNTRYDIINTNLLNAIKDFDTIESRGDLAKNHFTLADYNATFTILRDLVKYKFIDNAFLTESIKNYLVKFGIICNEKVKNVNWIIKLQ